MLHFAVFTVVFNSGYWISAFLLYGVTELKYSEIVVWYGMLWNGMEWYVMLWNGM